MRKWAGTDFDEAVGDSDFMEHPWAFQSTVMHEQQLTSEWLSVSISELRPSRRPSLVTRAVSSPWLGNKDRWRGNTTFLLLKCPQPKSALFRKCNALLSLRKWPTSSLFFSVSYTLIKRWSGSRNTLSEWNSPFRKAKFVVAYHFISSVVRLA